MSSVTVVGAGVFGAATARELALRGWDVTLVEQYTPGNVRSGSGGDTRLLALPARRGRVVHAARRGARASSGSSCRRRRARASGSRSASRGSRCGRTASSSERATLEAAGVPYEWLTPDDARDLYPSLETDDLHAVLFEPEAGVLHARRATQLLAEDGERRGVRLEHGRAHAGRPARRRRRRLGVRLVAPAVLSRARRAEDLAP